MNVKFLICKLSVIYNFCRYHILKFTLKWLRELKKDESDQNENMENIEVEEDFIELEMWKCLLESDMEMEVKINFMSLPFHNILWLLISLI